MVMETGMEMVMVDGNVMVYEFGSPCCFRRSKQVEQISDFLCVEPLDIEDLEPLLLL